MKKLFIVLLIIILSLSLTTSLADSGWDYSYDSGSSWGSSSDWGSSSWNISSKSTTQKEYDDEFTYWAQPYNNSTVTSYFEPLPYDKQTSSFFNSYYIYVFFDVIIVIVILLVILKFKKSVKVKEYLSLSEEEILKNNFSNEQAFEIYKSVQIAWSNFDYNTLRELTTDELYNTYKMQLEALELKRQQNIMRDITCRDIFPINVNKNSDIVTIKIVLVVEQKDYVVDKNTQEVLRGNVNKDNKVQYELTFIGKKENIEMCPNCGAKIEDSSSQTCSYCGATLVGAGTKWVLANKKIIRQ